MNTDNRGGAYGGSSLTKQWPAQGPSLTCLASFHQCESVFICGLNCMVTAQWHASSLLPCAFVPVTSGSLTIGSVTPQNLLASSFALEAIPR